MAEISTEFKKVILNDVVLHRNIALIGMSYDAERKNMRAIREYIDSLTALTAPSFIPYYDFITDIQSETAIILDRYNVKSEFSKRVVYTASGRIIESFNLHFPNARNVDVFAFDLDSGREIVDRAYIDAEGRLIR